MRVSRGGMVDGWSPDRSDLPFIGFVAGTMGALLLWACLAGSTWLLLSL